MERPQTPHSVCRQNRGQQAHGTGEQVECARPAVARSPSALSRLLGPIGVQPSPKLRAPCVSLGLGGVPALLPELPLAILTGLVGQIGRAHV